MDTSFFALGWRALWRDVRAGELRLLMVAVALAVAALAAVGFFADRLERGLKRDAGRLLGGDAVLVSDAPPPPEWAAQAAALGLAHTRSLTFPTMARAPDEQGGATRLVALKAVEAGYPLRGRLELAAPAGGAPTNRSADAEAAGVPPRGAAWVDPAVLQALGVAQGGALLLGDARFRVAGVIASEPDRGAGFMNFAPRVMVNAADLPATGLVQPASRITWRLAVAGPAPQVARFADWARARLDAPGARGMRLDTLESGRPEMARTLGRAEQFLNLVALLAALLSAVAVALAARGFASRRIADCAMLRVLGAPQRAIAGSHAVEFLLAGLLASGVGVIAGWAVHYGFVALLSGLGGPVDAAALPPPGPWPAALGFGVGLALLVAFGLPPVLQLARVPPLRVMRRDVGAPRAAALGTAAAGVAGFAGLMLAASGDLKLGLIAVGGFAGAAALFALLAWGAVRLLGGVVRDGVAPAWLVLATRQATARPAYAVAQVASLALGLLALMLLVLLRTDLIASWRAATPADAPDRFVINVMPDQAAEFRAALGQAGVARYDWYPMFRGRLVAIGGRDVAQARPGDERARRLLEREFNLSHAADKPPHNDIAAGRWLPGEAGAVSVESGLADTLGIKLGDALTFDVAGAPLTARVTSLRKVDWASMHVNFFVMFPVAEMPDVPITYIAAFRTPGVPAAAAAFDSALVRRFPNITSVDLSGTLAEVQRVLDQVIRAVEFLFGFTLAAGLVVLFAAATATREERARDFALMRALGASGRQLAQVQRAELAGVGLLAGVLAALVAMAVGWALAREVFDFAWRPPVWAPLAGGGAGAALALAAGWWALREVLRRPVVETLRRAA